MNFSFNVTVNSTAGHLNGSIASESGLAGEFTLCVNESVEEQWKKIINLTDDLLVKIKLKGMGAFSSQIQKLNEKIRDFILKTPLGSLDLGQMDQIQERFILKYPSDEYPSSLDFWSLYRKLDRYVRMSDGSEKDNCFQEIKSSIEEISFIDVLQKSLILNRNIVKLVYTSKNDQLVQLFYNHLPSPPLSLFDLDSQPEILVQRELQNGIAVAEVKEKNKSDQLFDRKIIYLQRQIRAQLRQDSEFIRVENNFKRVRDSEIKTIRMIEEANTPYTPQKCSPELAERLVKTAAKVKLYNSVSHLLCTDNVAFILDDCLLGRENLLNSYTDFRPAALSLFDTLSGDNNVICLGPDKIDPLCLKGRTMGLELDLSVLTNPEGFNKNPTLFFKQRDFGYQIEENQVVTLGEGALYFNHTQPLVWPSNMNLQLFSDRGELQYHAQVKRDLFISSNVKLMDQILILNFFRFLDNLAAVPSFRRANAIGEIERIYAEIGALDDDQLSQFLFDLGRKFSCSSEFNIYGGHKIDLDALCSITIYEEQSPLGTISIHELCEQLNAGDYTCLQMLKANAPEIFNSSRFINLLKSKVHNASALEMLCNLR